MIDDILAGLPENARLRAQLTELRSQVAALQRKNEELEAALAAAKPAKPKLDPDTLRILKSFFEHSTTLVADTLVDELKMKPGIVQHHFDKLRAIGFIRESTGYGGYDLLPAGRTFIVENGLA